MTGKELSQLYYLRKEIQKQEERIYILRAKAEKITTNISATYGCRNATDKISQIVAVIADLERLMEHNKEKCIVEQQRIEKYISSIEDSLTREIFRLRHIDCFSWNKVAIEVGGGNTADSVRMIHKRYLHLVNA